MASREGTAARGRPYPHADRLWSKPPKARDAARKRLRSMAKTGETTIYGYPAETILDLIYEAKREGRLK